MLICLFGPQKEYLGAVATKRDGSIVRAEWTQDGPCFVSPWSEWEKSGIPFKSEQPHSDQYVMSIEKIPFTDHRAKDALWQWSLDSGLLPVMQSEDRISIWNQLTKKGLTTHELYRFAAALSLTPVDHINDWQQALSEIV